MPPRLKRYYGQQHLHFVTFSCYRRLPLLTPRKRDRFVRMLEETRRNYGFVVLGFVVMPEHVHLLISEPEIGTPSTVIQVVKQRSAGYRKRRMSPDQLPMFAPAPHAFWQVRFYDFNVFSERKRIEKLRYMHRNPVKRGLMPSPELWPWSSLRWYCFGADCGVKLCDWPEAKMSIRARPKEPTLLSGGRSARVTRTAASAKDGAPSGDS